MSKLKKCRNISDLRDVAKRKLPAPMFDYIDGGADDEWTVGRNTTAFNDYQLYPQVLNNVEAIDLSTTVFNKHSALPFMLAPTGMSRLFHHEKELAVSQAAEKFGAIYSLSTMATTSIEEISSLIKTPFMFQIYILKDRELTREFVARAKAAGVSALCLTVDTAIAGNRERDQYHGFTMPPKLNLKSMFSYATHFEWLFNLALHPSFTLANVAHRVDAIGKNTVSLIDYVNSQFDRTVTWDDVAWLAAEWGGPFAVKGVLTPADAQRAVQAGASALMISNHGGRQLDGVPSPVDCIRPIRAEIGDQLELIVDGGVRRGTDIIKALALGADACSIGRPYLYGLAAGGQAGVERALEILRSELERSMGLLGVSKVSDIGEQHIFQLYDARAAAGDFPAAKQSLKVQTI